MGHNPVVPSQNHLEATVNRVDPYLTQKMSPDSQNWLKRLRNKKNDPARTRTWNLYHRKVTRLKICLRKQGVKRSWIAGVLTAIAPLDLVVVNQTIHIYILRAMWVWLKLRLDFNWVRFAPSGSCRRDSAGLTQNGTPSFAHRRQSNDNDNQTAD